MGKLKYTLTYILFWFAIIFSCMLAENFAFFSSDHMGGMNNDSLIMLSLFVIFALAFYFFLEHKKNKVTFDKILLPIIVAFGLISIATIWWQGPRVFDNEWRFLRTTISFSAKEKFSYSLQIVAWCAVLYGLLFTFNRFSISKKLIKWLPFVYVIGILACSFIDIIIEFNDIVMIVTRSSEYTKDGMAFIIYNSNVWAMLLLVGLISCVIMNLRKFNLFYFIAMIYLFFMIVLSSSSTSTFVGFGVIVIYTLFEILSIYRKNKKKSIILLAAFLGTIIASYLLILILAKANVPIFSSIYGFIEREILLKDYSTLTSRRAIWSSVFHLLINDPVDFMFGCGYKTGNIIFANYYEIVQSGFAARSAHDGIFEILLRHGVVGLLLYISAFIPFVIGVVKLVKQKQYRIAFIHSLCLFAIFGHSISESTLFFTPNIQGMYLTIVFYLPIIRYTKEKYFNELEEDLNKQQINDTVANKEMICQFISAMIMGLIVAFISTFATSYILTNSGALLAYFIVIGVLLIALFIVPIIVSIHGNKSINIMPTNEHLFVLLLTLVIGMLTGAISHFIFTFDLFSTLLFTLFVFVLYIFGLHLLNEKNNYLLFSFFNSKFSKLIRNNDDEVQQ